MPAALVEKREKKFKTSHRQRLRAVWAEWDVGIVAVAVAGAGAAAWAAVLTIMAAGATGTCAP